MMLIIIVVIKKLTSSLLLFLSTMPLTWRIYAKQNGPNKQRFDSKTKKCSLLFLQIISVGAKQEASPAEKKDHGMVVIRRYIDMYKQYNKYRH